MSSVSLHYDAEWPLSIVLNSKALGVYNSVFSFLLRIKRALWCLQRITAKQLSEAADNCRHFVAELERDSEMFLLSSAGVSSNLRMYQFFCTYSQNRPLSGLFARSGSKGTHPAPPSWVIQKVHPCIKSTCPKGKCTKDKCPKGKSQKSNCLRGSSKCSIGQLF